MGQTPNLRRQPAKARPSTASGTGGGPAGGDGKPIDFCLMTHSVAIELHAEVEIGTEISLRLSSPPVVLANGETIGTVSDRIASGLGRCLIEGYRFTGCVDSVDLEGRQATVTVEGKRGKR